MLRVKKCFCQCESATGAPSSSPAVSSVGFNDKDLWAGYPGLDMDERSEEERRHAFVTEVLQPILGKSFIEAGELVYVNKSFLREVAASAKSLRPTFRVSQSDVDYDARYALLLRNHAFISIGEYNCPEAPTYSVEVKPKCGFLEATSVNGTSRFHMCQALKQAQLLVHKASDYDPLDLFSRLNFACMLKAGQNYTSCSTDQRFSRGRQAFRALIANPQNNFNLQKNKSSSVETRDGDIELLPKYDAVTKDGTSIKDGTIRKDDAQGSAEKLIKDKILVGENPRESCARQKWRNAKRPCCDDFLNRKCEESVHQETVGRTRLLDLVFNAIICSGVLERILALQRLDKVGVDGAVALAASLQGIARGGLSADARQNALQLLRDFITSATAKDCSVMVTIQRANFDVTPSSQDMFDDDIVVVSLPTRLDYQTHLSQNICEQFLCRVAVVDLDLKSVYKLPHWLIQGGKISGAYESRA